MNSLESKVEIGSVPSNSEQLLKELVELCFEYGLERNPKFAEIILEVDELMRLQGAHQ